MEIQLRLVMIIIMIIIILFYPLFSFMSENSVCIPEEAVLLNGDLFCFIHLFSRKVNE